MNSEQFSSKFNLSTFNNPLIAIVTIIVYLNMVLLQTSNAIAMETLDKEVDVREHNKSKVVSIRNLTNDDMTHLRQILPHQAHVNEEEAIPTTQQNSPSSSPLYLSWNWLNQKKAALFRIANAFKSTFSPREVQILSYCAEVSSSALLMSSECVEPIALLWASYISAKATRFCFGQACQFVSKRFHRWLGDLSTEHTGSKVKTNLIRLDPKTTKDILKLVGLSSLYSTARATLSVTNANQNLTYWEPTVYLLPFNISGEDADYCQVLLALTDSNAGVIYSYGTSTISPSFNNGIWVVSGLCKEQVQPLACCMALNVTENETQNPIIIGGRFADGQGFVPGQISIYRVPSPSPTQSLSPSPTTTSSPSPTPIVSPTLSPTLTSTPTPSPSPSPIVSPTPTSTILPTASPTSSSTLSPTPFPPPTITSSVSPTSSSPFGPTSFDPKPVIITAIAVGAFLAILGCICCIWCACFKKDKKKKDKDTTQPAHEVGEATPLVQ